jgi:YVTN family beta-propeller protein
MTAPDPQGRWHRARTVLYSAGCTVLLAGSAAFAGSASADAASAAAAQPSYLYIASTSSNSVTEYDIATSSVVGTFAAGNTPVALAVTPDGSQLYVADAGSNQVLVMSTVTNKVVGTIAVGELPASIAFSPNGKIAYVLNRNSQSISVIDTATMMVTTSYSVTSAEGSSYGDDLAITPNGKQAFLPLEDGTVVVVDLATGEVVTTVTLGYLAWQAVASPNGKDVYATYLPTIYSPGYVAAISTATDKVVHRITTNGPRPGSIAISPDGKYVYTADFSDNMVDVITTASNAVTGLVDLPSNSYPVAVAADADFLFTADYTSNAVSQFDIPNNYQSEGEIPAGDGPSALAFVPAS